MVLVQYCFSIPVSYKRLTLCTYNHTSLLRHYQVRYYHSRTLHLRIIDCVIKWTDITVKLLTSCSILKTRLDCMCVCVHAYIYIYVCVCMRAYVSLSLCVCECERERYGLTDRQTYRHTHRHTHTAQEGGGGWQTDRQTDRQRNRQTDRESGIKSKHTNKAKRISNRRL